MPKAEVWDYWTNVPGGTRRLWAWACDDLAGQDFQSFEDAMHDCTIKVSAQLYSVQFDGQREGRPGQSRHVTASAPEHEKGQALEYAESSEGRNVRLGRGKSLPDGQAALTPVIVKWLDSLIAENRCVVVVVKGRVLEAKCGHPLPCPHHPDGDGAE